MGHVSLEKTCHFWSMDNIDSTISWAKKVTLIASMTAADRSIVNVAADQIKAVLKENISCY